MLCLWSELFGISSGVLAVGIGADLVLSGGFFNVAAAAAWKAGGRALGWPCPAGFEVLEAAGPGSKRGKPSSNLTGTNPVNAGPAGRIQEPGTPNSQGVMEQEKGFCGCQCWVSRAWESLGWSRGRDPTKASALPWGDQVGIC